jgi:hypothetical protein
MIGSRSSGAGRSVQCDARFACAEDKARTGRMIDALHQRRQIEMRSEMSTAVVS